MVLVKPENGEILKTSSWCISITDECVKCITWSIRLMAQIYLYSFYNSCYLMIYCIRARGGFWMHESINTVKATAPLTFVNVHSLTTRWITLLMNVPKLLSWPFPTIEAHLIMTTFSILHRVSTVSQQDGGKNPVPPPSRHVKSQLIETWCLSAPGSVILTVATWLKCYYQV